jgi:hypothetical protein
MSINVKRYYSLDLKLKTLGIEKHISELTLTDLCSLYRELDAITHDLQSITGKMKFNHNGFNRKHKHKKTIEMEKRILGYVKANGKFTIKDLMNAFKLKQSVIYPVCKHLVDEKKLIVSKSGVTNIYRLNPDLSAPEAIAVIPKEIPSPDRSKTVQQERQLLNNM